MLAQLLLTLVMLNLMLLRVMLLMLLLDTRRCDGICAGAMIRL